MKLSNNAPQAGRRIWMAALVAGGLMPKFSRAAAETSDNADNAVLDLVRRHLDAQTSSNVPVLDGVTAANYIEISPLGEVDPKEKMLGFYGTGHKRDPIAIQLEEPIVRYSGDVAIVIAKLTVAQRNVAMRVTYLAQKGGGNWKLVSAQYTPIRAPKAPA